MFRVQEVAAAFVVSGAVCVVGLAQEPAAPQPASRAPAANPAAADPAGTTHTSRYGRRSIVHHYPHPYPEYYHGDQAAGWRNPGGVGRYLEYYPPGDKFEGSKDPVRVAKFDQGGGAPDRAEQMAAQQIGIQRSNAIMQHIDNYSRPYIGYGAGYFGGFY